MERECVVVSEEEGGAGGGVEISGEGSGTGNGSKCTGMLTWSDGSACVSLSIHPLRKFRKFRYVICSPLVREESGSLGKMTVLNTRELPADADDHSTVEYGSTQQTL